MKIKITGVLMKLYSTHPLISQLTHIYCHLLKWSVNI